MILFYLVASFVCLLSGMYAALMGYFYRGWMELPEYGPQQEPFQNPDHLFFSIIVPARNEQGNIESCLSSLAIQDFNPAWFEIIIVDDFSEDDTAAIAQNFILQHPGLQVRLLRMANEAAPTHQAYKKAAISAAIAKSKGNWILTTDADCIRSNGWLPALADFILRNNPVLVSGPVAFQSPHGFFEKVQALEFAGLTGIGAASIALHTPNMCNGANLAFRKDAFIETGGYSGYEDLASGDDEFLMHKLFKRWPEGVFYIKNKAAIVYTHAQPSLSAFISQRKRWVSKSRKYERKSITAILSGAYVFHLCIASCLVAGFFQWKYLLVFMMAMIVKILSEYVFLNRVTRFYGYRRMPGLVVPAAFLYTIYVLFIGIYGNFGTYKWKGRTVR